MTLRLFVIALSGQGLLVGMAYLSRHLQHPDAEAIPARRRTVLVRTGVQEADCRTLPLMGATAGPLTPSQSVSLEVHDTGSGMAEQTLEKIFDLF